MNCDGRCEGEELCEECLMEALAGEQARNEGLGQW